MWTHLIGAIWALYTLIWINFSDTVPAYYDRIDIALSSIYLCCILVCMVLSSTYHLLCCISESHYHYWLKWDLYGIVIVGVGLSAHGYSLAIKGIMGGYFPGVYYAFYCTHV